MGWGGKQGGMERQGRAHLPRVLWAGWSRGAVTHSPREEGSGAGGQMVWAGKPFRREPASTLHSWRLS